jgi:chromosome segregation ATPase
MSAAVHRLDFPRSAFAPEQREEILRTAQAHIANRAQDQRDLADRLMHMPVEDKLAKWKREAAEAEAAERRAVEQRERESRREQRQAQRAATAGWSDWISTEIDRRLGAYAGEQRGLTDELLKLFEKHNEGFERIADRFDALKAENTALKSELAKVRSDYALAFERLTARIAVLESDASKNIGAVEAGFRAVSDEVARIRATPPVRFYLGLSDGPGDC